MWLAACLGLAGVIVLIGPWAIDWTDRDTMIGHGFLLGAALSWSLAMIVIRRAPPRSSMLEILPWCFALASLAMLPVVLIVAPHGGYGAHPAAWASLAFIGLVAGPVGAWCVMQATATLPVVVSSVGFLGNSRGRADPLQSDARGAADARPAVRLRANAGRGRAGGLARQARAARVILHTAEAGHGEPLVLLHGLFGAGQNFGAAQRRLAARFRVLALDLRNHGASPHDADMSYGAMAGDVLETLADRAALPCLLMAIRWAARSRCARPSRSRRRSPASSCPTSRRSPTRRRSAATPRRCSGLPLTPGLTRAQADAALATAVPDAGIRAFLLQNLRPGASPSWRIGLAEIAAALPGIEGWDAPQGAQYRAAPPCSSPAPAPTTCASSTARRSAPCFPPPASSR